MVCADYEVSNHGRVRRATFGRGVKRLKILKPRMRAGYSRVFLRRKNFCIHQLVAWAFLGPQPEGLVVNHIDGNPKNNAVENLEYITQIKNMEHHHLNKPGAISSRQIQSMRELHYKWGVFQTDVAACFGMHRTTVNRIVNYKRRVAF